MQVTGERRGSVKLRLRTGTVVTTDDRNWELRYTQLGAALQPEPRGRHRHGIGHHRRPGLSLPRALRDLLCVSDKPLHGEIKLPGQANDFYERAIGQHLRIGIETLEPAAREGEGLHSRKLRSFDEPPMR